jgi:tetratricopeptide (TPR) repeat protein
MELYYDALEYFDKALKLDPANFFCLYSKGVLYYLLGEQYIVERRSKPQLFEDAYRFLSKSIDIDPENELAFLYRAKVAEHLNDLPGARGDTLKAVSLKPTLAKVPEAQVLIKKYLME